MDDFTARMQRFRGLHQDRRPRQRAALKEDVPSTKTRSEPKAASPSTSNGIAALVAGWMGDQRPQKLDQTSSVAPHSSVFIQCSSSPSPLGTSPNFDGKCRGDSSDGYFLPFSRELRPLLADTIGFLLEPRDGGKASETPSLPHSSAPIVGGVSMAGSGSVAFSCVVLDLETTGFSPTADEILEVGCVELRWTPPSPANSTGSQHVTTCAPQLVHQSNCGYLGGLWTRGERVFHRYVRPSTPRRISAAAAAVHGITWERVQHCAPWPEVASELVAYLTLIRGETLITPIVSGAGQQLGGNSLVHLPPLVAHNATFDARFLGHHLRQCGYHLYWHPQYPVTCTRQWARVAYPQVAGSLDALCAFLGVDGAADRRAHHHGALTDANLTALLFLKMCRYWAERFGGAE